MATDPNPKTCSLDGPCVLSSKATYEELFNMNCKLTQLMHQCHCCTTRLTSGSCTSLCNSAGEVASEDVLMILETLIENANKVKQEVRNHEQQLKLRGARGRASTRDSGVHSWQDHPIMEEGPESNCAESVSPVPREAESREATENKDTSTFTRF